MYDAGNRKDIRAAEKAAKLREVARINYLVGAMSIPQGRAWFYDFLESCHIFADPFCGDALREAYSKGERNIGLKVYTDIVQNCPDLFTQMMKEANYARSNSGERSDSPGYNGDSSGQYTAPDEPDLFGDPDADAGDIG
jgi:hypothetical protein